MGVVDLEKSSFREQGAHWIVRHHHAGFYWQNLEFVQKSILRERMIDDALQVKPTVAQDVNLMFQNTTNYTGFIPEGFGV